MTVETPVRRSPDGRVVVDPRLRARRVEVRRDEGRKRLHRLMLAVSVLGLAAIGVLLVESPLLAVRHLRATPTPHLDARALRLASGVRPGQPMVEVSPGEVAHRLEGLPWVAKADVTRSWPGTISLSVTERTPFAQSAAPGGWEVLDRTGRVLEHRGAPDPVLPRVSGLAAARPGSVVAGVGPVLDLLRRLPAELSGRVAEVVASKGLITLRLAGTDSGAVRFGTLDQFDAKVVATITMLDHVEARCLGTIDVQVPNAPTLTPTPACA